MLAALGAPSDLRGARVLASDADLRVRSQVGTGETSAFGFCAQQAKHLAAAAARVVAAPNGSRTPSAAPALWAAPLAQPAPRLYARRVARGPVLCMAAALYAAGGSLRFGVRRAQEPPHHRAQLVAVVAGSSSSTACASSTSTASALPATQLLQLQLHIQPLLPLTAYCHPACESARLDDSFSAQATRCPGRAGAAVVRAEAVAGARSRVAPPLLFCARTSFSA